MAFDEIVTGSGCASSPDNLTKDADLNTCEDCVLCTEHLNTSTTFTSSVTKDRFSILGKDLGIKIACETKNVVYLITCKLCNVQYVGMTTKRLKDRFYGHRTAIKNKKINTFLYHHFLVGHNINDCNVQIIFHFEGNDSDAEEVLLHVEEFYMRKLMTLHPFGLNDHITSMNLNLSSLNFSTLNSYNTPYFNFGNKRIYRSHGIRKKHIIIKDSQEIGDIIDEFYNLYESWNLSTLYVKLRKLSRPTLENCLLGLEAHCKDHSRKFCSIHMILMAYRSHYIKPVKKVKEDFIYFNVPFIHKTIEKLGLETLFHSNNIKAHLPHEASHLKVRTTYSYRNTLGKKLFNYNNILRDLNKRDLNITECDCNSNYSEFVYAPHGHVHTGQLDIIDCVELRNVMSKGAKFRLTPSIHKTKIIEVLQDSILKLKCKLSKKCKMKLGSFDIWHDYLIKLVKNKCKYLKHTDLLSNDVFEKQVVLDYLKGLHERFVIVPVDKASNNFAIICKQFYIKVLMEELGVKNTKEIKGNQVYEYARITTRQFYKQQTIANKELGIVLQEKDKNIPLLYWTSKQHKDPYKFRFIAGASHCTNKTLSIEVALALKCIKTQFKNYCAVIQRNSGFSYFWSIDNSEEFLNKLRKISLADSIETFDFSTLYTNLPLDSIFSSLEQLIIKMYKNSGSSSIMVNAERKKSFWCHGSNYNGYRAYTIDMLLGSLHFILYNTHVQFAGCIFKQIKGIPMGGNASPFIADLYLAWHEYCYMASLRKSKVNSDFKLAKALNNNSRYLDDIAVVNFLDFATVATRIYHPSLILEGSSTGYHYDTFLDLNIRVYQGRFIVGIYNKTDNFSFNTISFPFPDSNIHIRVGYNSFFSQLVRFYRLCNNLTDFLVRLNLLYCKLVDRGYYHKTLYRSFLKFCNRYEVLIKFGIPNACKLWNMTLIQDPVHSCKTYDTYSISSIIKPCQVVLKDIYNTSKLDDNEPPKLPIIKEMSADEDNSENDMLSVLSSKMLPIDYGDSTPVHFIPFGLNNPSNHCYINSILQVFCRVLDFVGSDINFNDNFEGNMLKVVYDEFKSAPIRCLNTLKLKLKVLDHFFDGSIQRDAYECLNLILEILHKGTKTCILDVAYVDLPEDYFTSVTKKYFFFDIKHKYWCKTCGISSIKFSQIDSWNVHPVYNNSLLQLIYNSCTSELLKLCNTCGFDTTHVEVLQFQSLPSILKIIVNRFDYSTLGNKIDTPVILKQELIIDSIEYKLIASVHHHGISTVNGHWTCVLYYTDEMYYCNDDLVNVLLPTEISNDAYIALYARCDR